MAEAFYENEENLKKLCDFLRGKEGPAVREAIEMDKRVYYLKGKSSRVESDTYMCTFLLSTVDLHVRPKLHVEVPVGNTAYLRSFI